MVAKVLTAQEYRERFTPSVLAQLLEYAAHEPDREDIQREVPKIREALAS